ncbi:hypothetical protein [Clostridium sp. LP20]|uniref:hypothetical protein n=1 Tax=Clostridium sp. LP20 TaxID=3418665 RepID=UPI003EE4A16C
MGINVNRIKKADVYKLVREFERFLYLLEGTCIQSQNKYILREIEKQKEIIELLIPEFKPSLYEEYSIRVKNEYRIMIVARKEYERVVREHCTPDTIACAKEEYRKLAEQYEKSKAYRERLKSELSKV